MPDLEIIEKHLSAYLSDLHNIEKHKPVAADDLKNNIDLLWIMERGIYLLIQNLFDMLAHIAAADFNEKWDYYSELGEILMKNNLITAEEKKILEQMSGFRNRLSHEYLGLEAGILADIVNNKLGDFHNFLRIIKSYCRL
ncbi:MAG TPA: DUF86 domain-containing protein [Ignavibacteriaceae bacterium]|nr:DUF86 domain-containing protein [Ignavibacteriaceae bacterium]